MKQAFFYILLLLLGGCSSNQVPVISGRIDELPALYPDYTDVTVPPSIAPLNFAVPTKGKACAIFTAEGYTWGVYASNGSFAIPEADWKTLLETAKGKQMEVTILTEEKGKWNAYLPFHIRVSKDPIDPYIAYRLIDPGYQLWNEMGIYQRELATFKQEAILENRLTDNNCMNCHSFCMQEPDKMLFHVRAKHGCTVLVDGDRVKTLDTKTDRTISSLVYPCWHPSGRFVAFSVNNTTQDTHPVHRTEVYDKASDVVVYDVEKQEIITTQSLFSKHCFETFPAFSPDGKQLYFCSAPALAVPDGLRDLRYSLCRLSFDPDSRTFGSSVDTIFHAETEGRSILFPRVSPDGKYLLCTTTSYGTFPIWHKDADLCMFDLSTGELISTEAANSPDTDSYHSWSSNSKWVIFSSRRLDGLYTHLFIAHVNEKGILSKPFVLPQQSTDYYTFLTKSYNIPEFVKDKVRTDSYQLVSLIKKGKLQKVKFINETKLSTNENKK
ncbi:MAG: PD40 domain-containing protein [Parabacteroides sp.]|nr:PD40 domain-containing protein [Parabacteroides sp.]